MTKHIDLFNQLNSKFEGKISIEDNKEYITFDKEIAVDLFQEIKNNTGYRFLLDITATDYPTLYQIVYHVMSLNDGSVVRLNANLPKVEVDDYSIETIESIWKSANVMEREVYDLMGIVFENHSYLKKILTDDNLTGHPLRKDFILPIVERE